MCSGSTAELGRFASQITFEDLPSAVVEQAKKLFLDFVGITLGGSRTKEAEKVVNMIRKLGGREESTIIGFKELTSCQNAAFSNGVAAHALEFEDTSPGVVHTSPPIMPPALAAAERFGSDGRTLITAIVAGYETAIHIALGVAPNHFSQGFHPTGTCGCFGAAASSGRILGLSEEEMVNALGLAGTQASGLLEFTGSMSKRLNAGRAAQNGLIAALLAKEGFTGPSRILESDKGFCRAMSTKYSLERITKDLGKVYEIENVSIKTYSCCRGFASALDALFNIYRKYNLSPKEIERIVLNLNSDAYDSEIRLQHIVYEPRSILEAQLSFPYVFAVAVLEGNVLPKQFSEENISDRKILDMARKVEIRHDPKLDKMEPATIRGYLDIKVVDGKSFNINLDVPSGSPPFTWEQVMVKFRGLAIPLIGEEKALEVINIVTKLEYLKESSSLMEILRF